MTSFHDLRKISNIYLQCPSHLDPQSVEQRWFISEVLSSSVHTVAIVFSLLAWTQFPTFRNNGRFTWNEMKLKKSMATYHICLSLVLSYLICYAEKLKLCNWVHLALVRKTSDSLNFWKRFSRHQNERFLLGTLTQGISIELSKCTQTSTCPYCKILEGNICCINKWVDIAILCLRNWLKWK